MTPKRRALAACLLAAALALSILGPSAEASTGRRIVSTQDVAPGVTYKRIVNKKIPRVTHILTVDPSLDATLDVHLARPKFPGIDTTSNMAQAGGAIAAINGDFGILPGRPAHLFADDGELVQPAILGGSGRGFGFGADGTPMHIGVTKLKMTAEGPSGPMPVAHWNEGRPGPDEVAVFSPRGGTMAEPPDDSCYAHLSVGVGGWQAAGQGMARDFTVDAVRCGSTAMSADDGFVLVSKQTGSGAAFVSGLAAGDPMKLRWTLRWSGVEDVIGGSAVLVADGEMSADVGCFRYLCLRHPRTGVGITADGKVLMIVVEGRYWRSSGATLAQFAHIFQRAGATFALNLDGGGSSTMWIKGRIVNYLSDGVQREVTSSLQVVPDPAP